MCESHHGATSVNKRDRISWRGVAFKCSILPQKGPNGLGLLKTSFFHRENGTVPLAAPSCVTPLEEPFKKGIYPINIHYIRCGLMWKGPSIPRVFPPVSLWFFGWKRVQTRPWLHFLVMSFPIPPLRAIIGISDLTTRDGILWYNVDGSEIRRTKPPGMVLKPCKSWEKLPVPHLVSSPDFERTINSISIGGLWFWSQGFVHVYFPILHEELTLKSSKSQGIFVSFCVSSS